MKTHLALSSVKKDQVNFTTSLRSTNTCCVNKSVTVPTSIRRSLTANLTATRSRPTRPDGGAEIQQAIIDGMHLAFGEGESGKRRDFKTQDILTALEETVPLSAIALFSA